MNETESKQKTPNLLFVLVDQMRYSAMGCAGMEQVLTPNLDRLAANGALFSNAVSNIPVCTPARACMLTGRYPLSNTVLVNNSLLPNDMPSMGKILKNEGYSTGYIGKWHLAGEAFIGATKYNHGQNGYIPPGEMRHGFDYWAVHHCSHNYWNACYYLDEPEPIPISGWEPDTQTDLAIDFLRKQANQENPFAMVVSWGTPHTPFIAPDEYKTLYAPEKLTFRPNVPVSQEVIDNVEYKLDKKVAPSELLRAHTHNYYAAISNIDYNLGRLMDELEQLKMDEDTIVVFTSDHGEMLGSHGQWSKLQPWDESVRIPFIMRYPGKIRKNSNIDFSLNLPDILPTLLGLMDIQSPSGIEGKDCSGFITGEKKGKEPESSFLIWPCNACTWGKKWTNLESGGRGIPKGFIRSYRGVRTQEFTYVKDKEGDWMFYDNQKDPWQMNNLAEKNNSLPTKAKELLDEWLEKTGDLFEDTDYYVDLIDLETGLIKDPEKLVKK